MKDKTLNWIELIASMNLTNNEIDAKLNHVSGTIYGNIPGATHNDKLDYVLLYIDDLKIEKEIKVELPKEKKKINLVIANDTEPREYLNFLGQIFDITIIKFTEVGKTVSKNDINLVLFTGGEDVNPELYEEKVGKYTGVNAQRDKKEHNVFSKLYGIPMLGICRGSQFLTVMAGGRLVQHVENHGQHHSISVIGGGTYDITSTHHQMMYPYDLNEKFYELIGWSTYFRSNTYLDGNNEEIKLSKNFLETEIVYYNKSKSLCIQGHPEMSSCPENTKDYCLKLIQKYLFNKKDDKSSIKGNYGFDAYESDFDYDEKPVYYDDAYASQVNSYGIQVVDPSSRRSVKKVSIVRDFSKQVLDEALIETPAVNLYTQTDKGIMEQIKEHDIIMQNAKSRISEMLHSYGDYTSSHYLRKDGKTESLQDVSENILSQNEDSEDKTLGEF